MIYCRYEERASYDVEVFFKFMGKVVSHNQNDKIAIVLDNACIPIPLNYLELMFLPPYSSKLNLIEGLLKKESVVNKVFYKTVAEIKK